MYSEAAGMQNEAHPSMRRSRASAPCIENTSKVTQVGKLAVVQHEFIRTIVYYTVCTRRIRVARNRNARAHTRRLLLLADSTPLTLARAIRARH